MPESFLNLTYNAALLLLLVFIFDTFAHRWRREKPLVLNLITGLGTGVIGIIIIQTHWTLENGAIFDTRSILLGISGLYLGTIPTIVAIVITAIYRFILGGVGTLTGILVILFAGATGLIWRYLRKRDNLEYSFAELYLFGFVVHAGMILLMLTFPRPLAFMVIENISLPVLIIFPAATALLGTFMTHRLLREKLRAKISDEETKFRIVADHTSTWDYWISPEHKFIYCSASCQQVTGYVQAEFMNDPDLIEKIVHPGDAGILRGHKHNAVAGESGQLDFRIIHRNGQIRWIGHTCLPVFGKNGEFMGTRGSNRDITYEKEAEKKLLESKQEISNLLEVTDQSRKALLSVVEDQKIAQENLAELNLQLEKRVGERTEQLREVNRELLQLSGLQQAILGNAGLAIFATSPDGTIRLFNPAAELMFGYNGDEVVRKMSPLRFHHPEELDQHAAYLSQKTGESVSPDFSVYTTWLEKEGTFSNEWTCVRKDGTVFPMHLTISSYPGVNGSIEGIIGIARDISREKQAIESLERSEERFHAMFHEHAAIMLLVDPDTGIILEANHAARKFYGYSFSTDKPVTVGDINSLSADELKTEMENAVRSHRNYFVFRHRLSSGEFRTVEVHSSPIEVRGEKVLFSVIHDITDRRLAEEKLIRSEAENRAILSAIPDMLFRLDQNGTILSAHFSREDQLYLPYEKFAGKRIDEVLPGDVADTSMYSLAKAFEGKQTVTFEYALPVKNETRFYESRMVAIPGHEALAIIRDITRQTEALAALRRNETLMTMMTATSPLAFLVIDQRNDEILFFNHRYC